MDCIYLRIFSIKSRVRQEFDFESNSIHYNKFELHHIPILLDVVLEDDQILAMLLYHLNEKNVRKVG